MSQSLSAAGRHSAIISRRQVLAVAAAASIAPWLRSSALAADPRPKELRKEFFEEGKIPTISIELSKADYKSLQRDPRKYVESEITEDGETHYTEVGIHLKGAAGSFRPIDDKPGLTLNLDLFENDQKYHGMEKVHFNNSAQDPSYLTDLLCGEMFRAFDVPASKISHAHVSINGRKKGFYVLKEGFDKGFLKYHFGNHDGNFYDGGFLRDLDQPLDLIHSHNDAMKDQSDLKALFKAAQENDREKRFDKLEKLLDMDRFITYLAGEVFAWDWDGYPMQRNNYRVYHDPRPNKITFIPSGMDQMWGDPNGPLFPNFNGFIARGVIESKEGRKRYLTRMAELLKDGEMPAALVKKLDELAPKVKEELAKDDKGAADDHKNQVNRVRDGIRQRAKSLAEQLKKAK